MKKTLIALLALASFSYGVTTDATFTHSDNTAQAGYIGFTFNLSDEWLTANPAVTEEYTAFELTSITLQGANTWYKLFETNNNSGLVVLDSTNKIIGKSNWNPTVGTSSTVGGKSSYPLTYSFLTTTVVDGTSSSASSLTLDLDSDYKVLIYGNKTAFDALTINSTVTSYSGPTDGSTIPDSIATAGLRVHNGVTNGTMINNNGTINAGVFPVVSFSGQLVPEPTTATLSLLALAGLAARRRRK